MTLDPRLQELLERYPDELTDDELQELRDAADGDHEVEALLDAIHAVDAAWEGPQKARTSLSDEARAKLSDRLEEQGIRGWSTGGATPSGAAQDGPKAWSTGGATPSGSVRDAPKGWSTGGATPSGSARDAPKGWSTGGATPSGSAADAPKAQSPTGGAPPFRAVNAPPPGVVDIRSARRRRWARNPGVMAIAALLLVAVGFGLRDQLQPRRPEFTFKGAGPDGAIRGSLFVRGETRLLPGQVRSSDDPVTFRAVMTDAASLALLETQGGRTFVLWPPPGEEWRVLPGTHLLLPRGQSAEYRPGAVGEARYTLLGSSAAFDIPPDREVKSPEAFGLAHEDAVGLDELIVRWEGPAP